MKKRMVIGILFAFLCCLEAQAQGQYRKPLKSSNQSILGTSDYNVGLKLGCPWSVMLKSDLNNTAYDGHFGYLIGFLGERNFGKWSVSLESTFAQKGTVMHNEKNYQMGIDSLGMPVVGKLKKKYSLAYNAVTFRIPVTYYFKGLVKDDLIVPYVFAGPEIDIALPFNFNLSDFSIDTIVCAYVEKYDGPEGENYFQTEQTAVTPPPINISAVAGLGLMTKIRFENTAVIIKLDAAINCGAMNLAVAQKDALKWPFEDQDKRIFAHDVEVNLSIVFPIKKILRDACYYFNKR